MRRNRSGWRVGREIETSVWVHVAWGVAIILSVVFACFLVWYLTRLSTFTIDTISVVGGETISHDEVRTVAEKVLQGSYIRIIPFSFTYLVPVEKIEEALTNIPRIRDVDVMRITRNELKISFGEYVPDALWCADAEELSECYFLDSEGYAFSIAPPLRGGSLVRHIIEGAGRPEEKQMVSSDRYHRVKDFLGALESELGLRVVYVTHTEAHDSAYHLSGGGEILTLTDLDVESTLNNLKALLESKEYKHIEPGNFRYIDLRFGNKLFVNEQFLVATTSSTTVLSE